MTEPNQPPALSAAFPAPPPFYKHFTSANLSRLQEVRDAQPPATSSASISHPTPSSQAALSASALATLPPELLYLIPPPPPPPPSDSQPEPIHTSFNIPSSYLSPPSAAPTLSFAATQSRLTHLAKSLLLNFLELVGTLSLDPGLAAQKIEDLRHLFVQAQQACNGLRAHQAREGLISMMERQVDRRKQEVRRVRELEGKVGAFLGELSGDEAVGEIGVGGLDGMEVEGVVSEVDEERGRTEERERRAWIALEEIDVG